MKRIIVICLLLLITLPAAAVEGDQVTYEGGTASALSKGATGMLDTTSETSLQFVSPTGKLTIPYAAIESFQYSREVTHHLGVLPAIAVGLVKRRQRRHFFRISYHDSNSVSQVAVFEVPKGMPPTLQAILGTRAPRACKLNACGKLN